ncbi:MAG: ribbon-helix-helix protein, CopG family [Halobacteriales archaeon]|nr:ribbon-helix-helix protein, CopG family [Halobacteriales archaeon]
MATVSAKVPDAVARELRRKAKATGKTPSEVVRLLVEEYVAPPSEEWVKELLALSRATRGSRRRKRPADVDELTWAIDTTR